MENSVFIARILGPCCLVVAAGIMFNRKFYQRVMEDYSKNAALVLFGGMMALIIGIVVVLVHNVWIPRWPVIITIYGWAAVVKGIWLLVFPNTVSRVMQAYQRNEMLLAAHSILVFVLGIVLSIFGYFAG